MAGLKRAFESPWGFLAWIRWASAVRASMYLFLRKCAHRRIHFLRWVILSDRVKGTKFLDEIVRRDDRMVDYFMT